MNARSLLRGQIRGNKRDTQKRPLTNAYAAESVAMKSSNRMG